MISLRMRLLATASLVLAVFGAITAAGLTEANGDRALRAQEDRLRGLIYSLLGATDLMVDGNLEVSAETLADPRLRQQGSGLAALIADPDGHTVWRSPSLMNLDPPPQLSPVGVWQFNPAASSNESFTLAYGIRWLDEDDVAYRFTVMVAENAAHFFTEQEAFVRQLWLWLSIPVGGLLLAQLAVLAWALRPLKHLEHEVEKLEAGRQVRVEGAYPRELKPLQRALNSLLDAESSRRQRYSDALGDLSHSLKTPLAAARTLLSRQPLDPALVDEQLRQMDRTIGFQLRRTAAPASLLSPPIEVGPVLKRLTGTLKRVHEAKTFKIILDAPAACAARMDEDALFESLGNLLDNACKWARSRVSVELSCDARGPLVVIEDDGPGFPDTDLATWLERGARADAQLEGQGIGLAVSQDILRSAGGGLRLARSAGGGARVEVRLPA